MFSVSTKSRTTVDSWTNRSTSSDTLAVELIRGGYPKDPHPRALTTLLTNHLEAKIAGIAGLIQMASNFPAGEIAAAKTRFSGPTLAEVSLISDNGTGQPTLVATSWTGAHDSPLPSITIAGSTVLGNGLNNVASNHSLCVPTFVDKLDGAIDQTTHPNGLRAQCVQLLTQVRDKGLTELQALVEFIAGLCRRIATLLSGGYQTNSPARLALEVYSQLLPPPTPDRIITWIEEMKWLQPATADPHQFTPWEALQKWQQWEDFTFAQANHQLQSLPADEQPKLKRLLSGTDGFDPGLVTELVLVHVLENLSDAEKGKLLTLWPRRVWPNVTEYRLQYCAAYASRQLQRLDLASVVLEQYREHKTEVPNMWEALPKYLQAVLAEYQEDEKQAAQLEATLSADLELGRTDAEALRKVVEGRKSILKPQWRDRAGSRVDKIEQAVLQHIDLEAAKALVQGLLA